MRPSAAAEGLRRAHSLQSSLRPWHRRFAPHAPATKSLLPAGPPADLKVFARKKRRDAAAKTRSQATDRKSTRLNSSHRCISYAVFCLKKKKKKKKKKKQEKRKQLTSIKRTKTDDT